MPETLRFTLVELYKFYVTPSTRWLSLGSFLVSCLIALTGSMYLVSTGEELSVGTALTLATIPVGILVPIAAIFVFTSDWQHREVTTYFALVHRRMSLYIAKVCASIIISIVVLSGIVLFVLASTAVLAMVTQSSVSWSAGEPLAILFSAVIVGTLAGGAIGAALLSAPFAIAFFILQTLMIDPLMGFIPGGYGEYFRVGSITGDWASLQSGWAVVTSVIMWVILPFAIGALRFKRREP